MLRLGADWALRNVAAGKDVVWPIQCTLVFAASVSVSQTLCGSVADYRQPTSLMLHRLAGCSRRGKDNASTWCI